MGWRVEPDDKARIRRGAPPSSIREMQGLKELETFQIIASLDSLAAGPSYSVRRLAEALATRGHRSALMCTSTAAEPPLAGVAVAAFRSVGTSVPLLRKLYLSRGLARKVDEAAAEGAILHSHGLWAMPNLYPASAAARHGAVHVVSPRGMLGPAAMGFSRRQKQVFWWLAQHRALDQAACLHATSEQECAELRALGLKTPVGVIPNGIDVPQIMEVMVGKSRRTCRSRTVLYLGRIHPKKGIDRLIEAWARIEPCFSNWSLRVIGPSEAGHAEALATRVAELGLRRVAFEGALFGANKEAAYREADVFVLPTLNENFGMVVAEALANGTPVICTKGAPWSGLESEGCGWWIDHGVDPLQTALYRAMTTPRAVLDDMGANGRRWMAAEFSWDRVAADMEEVYRWCLAGQPRNSVPATMDLAG